MSLEPTEERPYHDLPDVAELFADHVRLIHWDGQTARIELGVFRPHLAGPDRAQMTAYPAARLVLTPAALAALHAHLANLIGKLEKDGVVKRISPAPPQRQ